MKGLIEVQESDNIKIVVIIVNAGFAEEIVHMAREVGARGATIINARGEGMFHRSFLGISVDTEKEMILMLAKEDTANKIMLEIKEKAGLKTPAHSICFMLPVDQMTGMSERRFLD